MSALVAFACTEHHKLPSDILRLSKRERAFYLAALDLEIKAKKREHQKIQQIKAKPKPRKRGGRRRGR